MLLAIRERIMGFLGWVILGLLIVAFAFWGLDSYLTSSTVNYVAKVNDVEISPRQHDNAYRLLVERMRESLGDNFERAGMNEEMLKATALQRLISDELIVQAAVSAGFAVGDQNVAARINSVDAFKKNGLFSKEQYKRILNYQGMSPAQFEQQLRREIVANQLKTGIVLTAGITEENFTRIFKLQGQQRRFDYLLLPSDSVADKVVISDQDLENYYSKNSHQFMTREQTRVQYIEMNVAGLKPAGTVEEAQIEALYEAQAERYVVPEERHARHILVTIPDTGETGINAARDKARKIVERLDAGEDFAVVASEMSDDTATASNGGDLGFFGPGVMTPKFEEAVFSMNTGERSEPVRTSFGFHVIEVLEIRPEQRKPVEEVRDELIEQLQADERADLFYEMSDTMANIAFEQPDSLQGMGEALDLDIQESAWIGRDGGPGIGAHDGVVEAIYSEDVLQNGNNSAVIEIGENHVVVLRVLEHQEARQQPLEQVRENVRELVRAQKLRELLADKGQAYLVELEQGNTELAEIAKASGQTLQHSPMINRNAVNPDRAIVSKAFSLAAPQAGKPVYSGFITPQGEYAIIALHEVQDGSVDSLTPEQRTASKRRFNRVLGASDVQMVLDGIERNASIEIPDVSDL